LRLKTSCSDRRADRKLNKCLSKALLAPSCHDKSEDWEILLGRLADWWFSCDTSLNAADCERSTAPCVSVVGGDFSLPQSPAAPGGASALPVGMLEATQHVQIIPLQSKPTMQPPAELHIRNKNRSFCKTTLLSHTMAF